MKAVWDNYIDISFDEDPFAAFKLDQFDLNYRKFANGKSALDVGVGRGEMLQCMKSWGFQYMGIDISPSAVRHCQQQGLASECVPDTVEWLRAHASQFDFLTCLDVLEHVPQDSLLSFLEAMVGALSEKGVLIIQVPNLHSLNGFLHHFNDITHVHGFSPHSLTQVLKLFHVHHSIYGFEELCASGFRSILHRLLRRGLWWCVRFVRKVNGDLNPDILNPVMFAVIRRAE